MSTKIIDGQLQTDVAVIGGGLGGLYTSRLLHAAGVEFMLFEARDRLGGRVLTVDETGKCAASGFDLGPSWFWPTMQPAMGELVDELGLESFAQHSDGDVIFERISREPLQRYRGAFQGPRSMRVAGGTGAIISALSNELPSERIRVNAQVTALTQRNGFVEMNVGKGADGYKVTARQVIATVPPRLLAASIVFDPIVDAKTLRQWRETPTWMAPHAKFFALYERPFWRRAGLSGTAQSMVGPMMEMHDATTASGAAALFGFLGVPIEDRIALGNEALTRMCIDQFTRIFGSEAQSPTATLFKDWAADPFTATSEDRGSGGHNTNGEAIWVSGSWQPVLTLAGSETSPIEPGYLAGAVDASKRAVASILRRADARTR